MEAAPNFGGKIIRGVLIGLAAAAVSATLWALGWMELWEAKTWDWRQRVMAEPGPATDAIRLILLDQDSLDWARTENGLTWPWPREMYAALVDFCTRQGARAVVFDVLFAEPSPYGVDDDTRFATAVSNSGRFVGTVFLGRNSGSTTQWPGNLPSPAFQIEGLSHGLDPILRETITYPRAAVPIPEVARRAALLGNVHLDPDPDGIYRRISLFARFDGKTFPSLGLAAFLAAHPEVRSRIASDRLQIGNRTIPIDTYGNAILRYRGPARTHRAYSAAAVLQSEIRLRNGLSPTITDPDAFKDKYVFFGFTAPALYDLKSAPVGGIYPGVEVHATFLDNLLSNDFMRKTPAALDILVATAGAVFCAISLSFLSGWISSIGISAGCIGLPLGVSLWMYHRGLWISLVLTEAGVVFSILFALVFYYATEGKQKRFIKNAFKQYLSPAVIDQLIAHPERLTLGGERRTLSIFFSDLEGFTTLSEGLTPEALTALLNEYLSAMTRIIHAEGGTVDKYEGDAIIAFWNAPMEVSDHAFRAVRAALGCQERLAQMRPGFASRIGKEVRMRIGIHTGPAVVGNLGSETRFDYTMLGDAVNLASRLEGANKALGTYTMVSDATRGAVGNVLVFRELARLAVVGRKEPVTVFEPMFPETATARKDILETFYSALYLFYKADFTGALEGFSRISDRDGPAAAYAQKCRELCKTPPERWEGVWVLAQK